MSKLDELIQELCPNGVEYKELGDVVTFLNGRAYKQNELLDSGKYKVLRVGNFYTNNQWYYSNLELDDNKYCQKGDLLYTWAATIGPQIWNGEKVIYHYHIWKLIYDDSILNKHYLFHYLKKDINDISNSLTNSTMPHVSMSSMKKRIIPIPPMEVQQEIVRLLDEFTAKTAELQAELNKEYETRKKQYECYKDMLLNNPENFMITTIGDISESVTVGIANSATQAYSETGVTMLRNQNIKENYLDDNDLIYINNDFSMKYKNKLLKKNDILVTRTGYPGVACVVPEKYEGAQTFTTLIVRLQNLKITNPKYVCYYINSLSGKQYVRKMQSGAAQQNFGATALSKMPINIPDITTQNYIVKIFENFDSTHSKISMALLSEIESRQKQYEFYRDKLLTFNKLGTL